MSEPLSVVVPLYNKPLSITRCIRSIIDASAERDIDIIIVDDGSTDGSREIAERLAASDPRIVVLKKPNGGVSSARNAGIAQARGTHVLLLDADDRWSENHIDVMEDLISNNPGAALYATNYACHTETALFTPNMVGVPPAGSFGQLDSIFLSFAYGAMPVSSSSVCIPKDTWEKVGGFRTDVGHGEDRIFWVDSALHGPVAMANVVTAHYHLDAENRSFSSWTPAKGKTFRDRLMAIEEMLQLSTSASTDVEHVRECIMGESYRLGKNCGSLGFDDEARSFGAFLNACGYEDAATEVMAFVGHFGERPTFDFPSPRRADFLNSLLAENAIRPHKLASRHPG